MFNIRVCQLSVLSVQVDTGKFSQVPYTCSISDISSALDLISGVIKTVIQVCG